jgi:hypothetical protein
MASNDETTAIVIHTASFRVEGRIALVPGARLTDYIRSAEDFVAVTQAVVYDKAGSRMFTAEFMDVGRQFIELIVPAELIKK